MEKKQKIDSKPVRKIPSASTLGYILQVVFVFLKTKRIIQLQSHKIDSISKMNKLQFSWLWVKHKKRQLFNLNKHLKNLHFLEIEENLLQETKKTVP